MIKKIVFFVFFLQILCFALDRNIKSLSADFVQYTQDDKKEVNVRYEGSFVALSPFYARWEYRQPVQKIVYFKDSELISYEPVLSQAIFKRTHSSLNFLKIIQDSKQDAKDPNLFISVIDEKLYRLFVQGGLPMRLEYEDALGNLVIIEFKNVILNPKISKDFFSFTPPKGIDLIKE